MSVKFKSTININDEYTLPLTDGTDGQVIATDGLGNLSFQTVQSGSSLPNGLDNDLLVYNLSTGNWEATKIVNTIQFEGGTGTQGTMSWNVEDETVDLIVSPDVTYQLGQELGLVVRNISGQTINNGGVVKVTGASGNKVTIDIADNTGEYESSSTFAVVTETIANNSTGRVTTEGLVRGLDTSTFTEGVAIWLGTNGQFTATKPLSPNHLVHVGWVVRSHATEGAIFVKISNGWEIEELHDVLITNAANKDLLSWNATLGVWENTKTLGDITTGNITTAGTVDGVDISLFKSSYDSHNHDDRYYTETEINTLLTNKTNWDTAYSWGNHATVGYLTSYTETDPVFTASAAGSITSTQVTNWDTAYSWGNHATVGYLTSYTETDPVFTASPAGGITGTQVTNWDNAYGWGDHSLAGYSNDYTISYISADTTAVTDNMYVFTATLTLTLPATPAEGDKVAISNMSGTTTPIIARNGSNIAGLAEDLTIDINNVGIQFVYTGASKGWILI